jgi:hypothetical protein
VRGGHALEAFPPPPQIIAMPPFTLIVWPVM